MRLVTRLKEVTDYLDEHRQVLWAPTRSPSALFPNGDELDVEEHVHDGENWYVLKIAQADYSEVSFGLSDGGAWAAMSELAVTPALLSEIHDELRKDTSDIRKRSTRLIERSFVYIDISDYSKMPDGLQLLVVMALIQLADGAQTIRNELAEAQLCIGDGYIYVWPDAVAAMRFAGNLALAIERAVAGDTAPEFHFRIGVHTGPVRWFRDPGRDGWNYAGSGINGGNRVLSAIGKDTDDVVFVSSTVRQAVLRSGSGLETTLLNRGRKVDKHGNPWRVYELNHARHERF
jgi:class 3 adenylate cyclase